MSDAEKLSEALELVVEVRNNHRENTAVIGPLIEATRDIRQVRNYLEGGNATD